MISDKEIEEFDAARANGKEFTLEEARLTASLLARQCLFQQGALDLSQKYLRDTHIEILAEGLKQNCSVSKLDLSREPEHPELLNVSRSFGDPGIIKIAEALAENRTLTSLDLRWIKIHRVGYLALAKALSENGTLTKLKITALKENKPDDYTSPWEQIKKAQSRLDNRIQYIRFYHPFLPPSIESVKMVKDLVRRNRNNRRLMTTSLVENLLRDLEEPPPEKCSIQ